MAFSPKCPDLSGIHKASSPMYIWDAFPEVKLFFKSISVSNLRLYLIAYLTIWRLTATLVVVPHR
jgi:hypothetical protein